MESMNAGDDQARLRHQVGVTDLRKIEAFAKSLRVDFGESIDCHPGGVDVEAGTINRAFRIAVTVIVGDDRGAVQIWLREVARSRLEEIDVVGARAEKLIDSEPGLGDAWLAYLGLAPKAVIEDCLRGLP
jgi:hypothetical protein